MKIIVNNKAEFDSIINQLKHEPDQKEINQAAINLSKGIKIKGWFSINFIIGFILFMVILAIKDGAFILYTKIHGAYLNKPTYLDISIYLVFIIDIVLFTGSILTAILLRRWSNWLILFVIPLLLLHY